MLTKRNAVSGDENGPKQPFVAATVPVIWLFARVRYWSDHGLVLCVSLALTLLFGSYISPALKGGILRFKMIIASSTLL